MRLSLVRCVSRGHLVVLAVAAAIVGTLTLAPAVQAAKVLTADDPAVPEWYMLVNDYYDGAAGHPVGPMKCLSTNHSPPPGGVNTHTVYLATCNSTVRAQWWRVTEVEHPGLPRPTFPGSLENKEEFSALTWCLSANSTTPAGGSAGTHGAYTAVCSGSIDLAGQGWRMIGVTGGVNQWIIQNQLKPAEYWDLSASAANPLGGGGYRVYTSRAAQAGTQSTPAQVWRLYRPSDPPD